MASQMDNFERQKCWKTSQKDEVLTGLAPYNLLLKASSSVQRDLSLWNSAFHMYFWLMFVCYMIVKTIRTSLLAKLNVENVC